MPKKMKKGKRKAKPLSRVSKEMAKSFGILPKKRTPPDNSTVMSGNHWHKDGIYLPYSL